MGCPSALPLITLCSFSHICRFLWFRDSWQQFQPACQLRYLCSPSFSWLSAATWLLLFWTLIIPIAAREPSPVTTWPTVLLDRGQTRMSFSAVLLSPSPGPWKNKLFLSPAEEPSELMCSWSCRVDPFLHPHISELFDPLYLATEILAFLLHLIWLLLFPSF